MHADNTRSKGHYTIPPTIAVGERKCPRHQNRDLPCSTRLRPYRANTGRNENPNTIYGRRTHPTHT
eukprot:scaffold44714_cov61-Cyclotella_meneghiniana.AAC.5